MANKQEVIEIEDDDATDSLDNTKLVTKTKRRIIFCIDVDNEMETQLKASANGGIKDTNLYFSSRLETVTRYIKRYIVMNQMILNNDDQYAIMILKDTAQWWIDFSSSANEEFENKLEGIYSELGKYANLDTSTIFRIIGRKVDVTDPNYFTQVILIYSRDTPPTIAPRAQYSEIRNSKNFTLDIIYLHGSYENVQTIYDLWNDFDSNVNRGWYYETGVFNGKDILAKAFSQLLAHPLQRGEQERIEDCV